MKNSQIKIGDQFKIRESGKVLLVQALDKNKNFKVHYYDNSSPDLILDELQINRYLNFESWIKIKI